MHSKVGSSFVGHHKASSIRYNTSPSGLQTPPAPCPTGRVRPRLDSGVIYYPALVTPAPSTFVTHALEHPSMWASSALLRACPVSSMAWKSAARSGFCTGGAFWAGGSGRSSSNRSTWRRDRWRTRPFIPVGATDVEWEVDRRRRSWDYEGTRGAASR